MRGFSDQEVGLDDAKHWLLSKHESGEEEAQDGRFKSSSSEATATPTLQRAVIKLICPLTVLWLNWRG